MLTTIAFANAANAVINRWMFGPSLMPDEMFNPDSRLDSIERDGWSIKGPQSFMPPPEAKGNPGGQSVGTIAISKDTLPKPEFTIEKLQHEYKHAEDFGVSGNWNKAAGESYQSAIQNHFVSATDIFKSTYRGQEVFVYINKSTGVGAYTNLSGGYIGGWKFSPGQIAFHFSNGIRIN